MHRRTLLACGASVILAGCSVTSPVVRGTPAAPYTPPPPTPFPGAASLADLEGTAEAVIRRAAGIAWAGAEAPRWVQLAEIRAAHRAVLATVDPLRRQPGTPAALAPPTAAAPATRDQGLAECSQALVAVRDRAVEAARGAQGQTAGLWASLAASAEQGRLGLTAAFGSVRQGSPMVAIAATRGPEALASLILRYHEAVFGLSSALGLLPIGHAARAGVSAELVAARTERDSLIALDRAASATPPAGPGNYSLPPAASPEAVLAMCASLQTALAQAAGVWVASADDERRPRAIQALITAATLGLPLGHGVAVWPGWPDQG